MARIPDTDPVSGDEWDCRHGCNGDCLNGGESDCGFTCHEEIFNKHPGLFDNWRQSIN